MPLDKNRIGILGSGQLGRMLALAAAKLGIEVRFFDAQLNSATEIFKDRESGAFDDKASLKHFCSELDLVTYEFENIPLIAGEICSELTVLYPPLEALKYTQDRLLERELLAKVNVPHAEYRLANSQGELLEVAKEFASDLVVKTLRQGYDGKGQARIYKEQGLEAQSKRIWLELKQEQLLAEKFVPFKREISLVAVRSSKRETLFYPIGENHHRDGILFKSIVPAPNLSANLEKEAIEYTRRIIEELDYVGVIAVEFFDLGDKIVANEIAPRVHNSGHWSQDGVLTSQFENHIRAILGAPLGDISLIGATTMFNIIGELPNLTEILQLKQVQLHLYHKSPRAGRKIGHINVVNAKDGNYQTTLKKVEEILNERVSK
jgi:5-(carboxyamino)imidazole ribonucleotide synthase